MCKYRKSAFILMVTSYDFVHRLKSVLPSSPNPDPISDQKMSFFTPIFRPGL